LIELLPENFDDIIRRIEYGSIAMGFVYLHFLLASFGSRPFEKYLVKALSLFSFFLIGMVCVTSAPIFTRFLPAFQAQIIGISIGCLGIIARAVVEQRPGSRLICASVVLIFLTVIHDVVVAIQGTHGLYIVPLGIAAFLIFQVQLLVQKASDDNLKAQFLASEREHIQKELRLEVESRFELASEIAHRLNNPLNYISVSSAEIRREIETLEEEVLPLFQDQAQSDPHMEHLRQYFVTRFCSVLAPFRELEEGLRLAATSVAEIRALSGIDGRNLLYVNLKTCLRQILVAYVRDRKWVDDNLDLSGINEEIFVYADVPVVEHALQWVLGLDRDFPKKIFSWQVSLVEERDSPLLGIVLSWRSAASLTLHACQQKENQANHILKSSHAKVKFHLRESEKGIEIFLPRIVQETSPQENNGPSVSERHIA
jgi:signal transduction histidine kinase